MAVEGDGTLCLARCVRRKHGMASLVKICTGRFLPAHRSLDGMPMPSPAPCNNPPIDCIYLLSSWGCCSQVKNPTVPYRSPPCGGSASFSPSKRYQTRKHNELLLPLHFQNVHQGDDCRDQEEGCEAAYDLKCRWHTKQSCCGLRIQQNIAR